MQLVMKLVVIWHEMPMKLVKGTQLVKPVKGMRLVKPVKGTQSVMKLATRVGA
jgi:hypothetical protein